MGKKNKSKTMGSVPSSYYELNVDSVVADEELHDVDGNKVYEEVLKTAEEEIEKAKNMLVESIGEEELPRECLGVIDVSGCEAVAPPSTPEEEEKKDDGLSQKQKAQKGGYNGWWWWRK
jgi:ferritin-like protein